jgi:hypothetical protein
VFKAHRPRGNRDFAGEIISFLDELADIPLETRRDPLEPGDVAADNSELHPMSPNRVRWEHIHRVYEMCGRNAGLAQYARQAAAMHVQPPGRSRDAATALTENLVATADRRPTSGVVPVSPTVHPKDGPSLPPPRLLGPFAFDVTVLSLPRQGKPHETYDNGFGFGSCGYFIHGFRTGNGWWRCQRRGHRCGELQ